MMLFLMLLFAGFAGYCLLGFEVCWVLKFEVVLDVLDGVLHFFFLGLFSGFVVHFLDLNVRERELRENVKERREKTRLSDFFKKKLIFKILFLKLN